jgi:aldose sugar dehydrogenase
VQSVHPVGFVTALFLLASASPCVAAVSTTPGHASIATERAKVRVETVASKLEHAWGMAFLPDGRALVTERPGRLRIIDRDGNVSEPVQGVPAVHAERQGGLLDVVIDPDFARNQFVYLSYAEPRAEGLNGTAVARGRLTERGFEDAKVIFRQQPSMTGGHHFGSRLVFARDGTLFVTLGDRNIGRDKVQDPGTDIGKVIRIDRDGKPPANNPFVEKAGTRPGIWSLGHRNIQGAALHPATGELWTNEHGPKGGDELNRTLAGRNYGWPLVSHGIEYSGKQISERPDAPGMEAPVHVWVPSIGTSGLVFYTGERIPQWRGNAFVGGLVSKELVRLEMDGNRVVHEERLFGATLKKRVRDVEQGPDGALYLLTDEADGELLRVVPAD